MNTYAPLPPACLVATITPRVEVRAEVDLQPAVAEVLDADLQVERELVQVEAEAMRLHQIPAALPRGRRETGGGRRGEMIREAI